MRPREEALSHRLSNSRLYLDDEGRLHPEIWQARREIMRASATAGLYSLHLPEEIGGGLGRREMLFVEERVYGYGVGLNPAILSWSEGRRRVSSSAERTSASASSARSSAGRRRACTL